MTSKQVAGTLIIRVVLGLIFFMHGLDKFQGGIANTVGFFESVGIPGFSAYIVASIELLGGAALIIGLGTKVVSLLLVLIMIGALFTVKFSAGFLGGYELDLALLAMSIYVALTDKDTMSLDHAFSKRAA